MSFLVDLWTMNVQGRLATVDPGVVRLEDVESLEVAVADVGADSAMLALDVDAGVVLGCFGLRAERGVVRLIDF